MGKKTDFDIANIIAELSKLYEQEIIRGFVNSERYDLLFGYALTNKGGVIEGDSIRFYKENSFGKQGGLRLYTDKVTELLTKVFQRNCANIEIKPKLDWQSEALLYVSPSFIRRLKLEEDKLLKEANIWDIISFAQRVPHVNLNKIEEKLIREGNRVQLLAYAETVKLANKDKIREALASRYNQEQ